MAQARARGIEAGEKVTVNVTIATGTYHRLSLYGRTSDGLYELVWSEGYPSKVGGVEIEAEAGSILRQRTVSPASAEPLERYGVTLPEGKVDWGAQSGWGVNFGPVGSVTHPGPHSPTSPVRRGRVFAPHGAEVAGGAVSDNSTTSGD